VGSRSAAGREPTQRGLLLWRGVLERFLADAGQSYQVGTVLRATIESSRTSALSALSARRLITLARTPPSSAMSFPNASSGHAPCNLVVVFQPYSDVDVVVRSRYRARMKVDCPAAEQPVVDSVPFEELMNLTQHG
jgi:hypothetical protein